jgi:hypothetical protein
MTEPSPMYAAFVAAQSKMQPAIKGVANPHLKSKYADLQSVVAACGDALHENGFAIVQPLGRYDDGGYYVETILQHSSGDCMACKVPLILNKQDMQGLGSAITYARRYGLMTMAGIAPEDDDGEGAGKADPKRGKAKLPPVEYNKPDRPSEENIITAVETLEGSESLDDLQARWSMLGRLQVEQRVFDTKERLKTQLAAANTGGAIDDEIPY